MKKNLSISVILTTAALFSAGCGAMHDYYNMAAAKKLVIVPVDPPDPVSPETPEDPITPAPLFGYGLGNTVQSNALSDQSFVNDYDGDGISNAQETTTNPFVAEYPRIVTRIDTPISVEIRSNSNATEDNVAETISGSETKDTLSNSMESKQYAQASRKTTPYVTKEAYSDSVSNSSSWGSSQAASQSDKNAGSVTIPTFKTAFGEGGGGGTSWDTEKSNSLSSSNNGSIADSLAKSTSTEKTVFQDVDYVDNLDRNGIEMNDNKVQSLTSSYRASGIAKNTVTVGPNAGVVSSCLYIHNLSVNYPVRVSNVKCTLSFRTPSGQCQAVKTFFLRNDDYSPFAENIYGNEEKGPYAIVIDGLNTDFVKKSLSNGWVPQISVVSYDTSRVKDSNYNPGVDNLQIVEENAKGRTAQICIRGQGTKESYRVAAFDLQGSSFVPGISLKKALFNIMADRIGSGEKWEKDANNNPLTVPDSNLKWMSKSPDFSAHTYSLNTEGNSWRSFETYVKQYTDDTGKACRIETIKRLFALKKYNPFDPYDNANYNPSELLPQSQMEEMQIWVVYHNGRYYEGDINDPVWPGERYEIVCLNIGDFNRHFANYYYTPLQSMASFDLDTRWNALSNDGEFARSVFLGQIVAGDYIHLSVNLNETRNLFLNELSSIPLSDGRLVPDYTCGRSIVQPTGIPKSFSHQVKGDVNSFILSIEPSENARSYDVIITGSDSSNNRYSRSLNLSYSQLAQNSGVVIINRNSLCSDSNRMGVIPSGNYIVKVNAVGLAYGADIKIQSSCNSNASPVSVSDPKNTTGPFAVTAVGYNDQLEVCLSRSAESEYYDAVVAGPLNSGYSDLMKTIRIPLHSGYNYVSLVPPSADRITEPGLYRVSVIAENTLSGTQGASSEVYVSVPYDKYLMQKDSATRPMLSTALEKLGSVDLEVNFNDGNGWFALQTSGVDDDLNGKKKIDCRFTSFIDYKAQKFDIYFGPPAGSSGIFPSLDDIFAGGRQVADVFIRTRAKPEYRDTLWPRKQNDACFVDSSCGSPADIIRKVITGDVFDATAVESPSRYSSGYAAPGIYDGNTLVKKDNLFFAPLKERQYSICAALTGAINQNLSAAPLKPSAIVSPMKNAVRVRNIAASDGTLQAVIFYKAGTSYTAGENIVQSWTQALSPQADALNHADLGLYVDIPNLVRNQPYEVAVIGLGRNGRYSDPYVANVIPFGGVSQSKPSIVVNPQTVNRDQVQVNSLYIQGETRYQIWGKISGAGDDGADSTWTVRFDTIDTNSGNPCPDPVSHNFSGLKYATQYLFRARPVSQGYGINGNAEVGTWSDVSQVMTLPPSGLAPTTMTVAVQADPGNSVEVSDLQVSGECRYQIWYKVVPQSGDSDADSSWTFRYDTYAQSIPEYGAVTKIFPDLQFWTNYKFKARSASVYASSDMLQRTDPADIQYIGTWSDAYEVMPRTQGGDSVALLSNAVSNTGSISVSSLTLSQAEYTHYDLVAYVEYDYSGTYHYANSYSAGSGSSSPGFIWGPDRTVGPGTGRTTYAVSGLRGLVSGVGVSRGASSPSLDTVIDTGCKNENQNPDKKLSDFVTTVRVTGYKFIFHTVGSGVSQYVVTSGTTW